MIDPNSERIYNIILSIFFGIMIALIFTSLYEDQRSIVLNNNK